MKKAGNALSAGLLLLVLLLTGCTGSGGDGIVGTWGYINNEGIYILISFEPNGRFEFRSKDNPALSFGGSYTLNVNVDPHHLDMRFDDGDQLRTIISFPNRKSMQFFDNSMFTRRPESFDDDTDSVIVLRRE